MIKLHDWSLSDHPDNVYLPENDRVVCLFGKPDSGPFEGHTVTTSRIKALIAVIDGFPVVETESGTHYHLQPSESPTEVDEGPLAVSIIRAALNIPEPDINPCHRVPKIAPPIAGVGGEF